MIYDTSSEKREVLQSKPLDWDDKMSTNKRIFLLNEHKIIYTGCGKSNWGICIGDEDKTNEEEIFSLLQAANISKTSQEYYSSYHAIPPFWGLRDRNLIVATINETKVYLWSVSFANKTLRMITEWDIIKKTKPLGPIEIVRRQETRLPISDKDHIRGDGNAPVTLLVYSDIQDSWNQDFYHIYYRILKEHPRTIKGVYRHYPRVSQNPYALEAAQSSECAGEQGKFWEYLDTVFLLKERGIPLNETLVLSMAEEAKLNVSKFKQCLDSGKYRKTIQAEVENIRKDSISWQIPSAILITPKDKEIPVDQKDTYNYIVAKIKPYTQASKNDQWANLQKKSLSVFPAGEFLFTFLTGRGHFLLKATYDGATFSDLGVKGATISPDNRKVLYVDKNNDKGTYEVKLMEVDFPTSSSRTVVSYPQSSNSTYSSDKAFRIHSIIWSEDQSKAMWSLHKWKDGKFALQYVDFRTNKLGFVANPLDKGEVLFESLPEGEGNAVFSHDGKFIFFIYYDKQKEKSIAVYNLIEKISEQLESSRADRVFSDVNSKLYYFDLNRSDVTVYDPYTRKREYLSSIPSYWDALSGSLNLEKTKRVFACNSNESICISDVKGANKEELAQVYELQDIELRRTQGSDGEAFYLKFSWTPDGSHILIQQRGRIWIFSVQTGESKKILDLDVEEKL